MYEFKLADILLGMTKQNKNNQTMKDEKAKPSRTWCDNVLISAGYAVLLQNDRQNHTCFYTCTHIYYTGKGFHTHGIPCGWCRGCCLQSTCHSAGSGAAAEGPGLAGLGPECSAGCFLCWEYSCGHLVHCSALPLDWSSVGHAMAAARGSWERSSEEHLPTRQRLPPGRRAAGSGKAFRQGTGPHLGTPGFGFQEANWTAALLE